VNEPRPEGGRLHEISHEIGGLKTSVEMLTKMWSRQDEAATAGRRALHDRFEMFKDEVGLQLTGLSLRVDRLVDQVKKIEPSVQAFHEEKLRDEGAKRLGARLYAGLVAGAAMIGWGAHEFISWIRHP
jgi:hypothetical protein